MSGPQRIWRALESVHGLRAVAAEWRGLLGEEFEAASRLLSPDSSRASAHPCSAPNPCGCYHDVIEHGPEDLVAVCSCHPRRCETLTLTQADIVVYELDRRALGDAIAAALGAVVQHAPVPALQRTWSLGTYVPRPGHPFPVHLTVQTEPADLARVAEALVARAGGPFILAAPTRDLLTPQADDVLQRVRAHFLPLAEEFALGPDGKVTPRRPPGEMLKSFLAAVLPMDRPDRWSGRVLTSKEAAKILGHQSGTALLKALSADRIDAGDPLYALRQDGPARTPGGRFYEDAVTHVAGEIASAGDQYKAGAAKRQEQTRAAKAATARPDPAKAERRFMQDLARREKNGE